MNARTLTLLTLLLAACADDAPADEPGATDTTGAEVPTGTDAILSRLRARHVEDLPTPEDLAAYPDAPASLRHIATTERHMVTRARALALLRIDASDATRTLLLDTIREGHPSLVAAAIEGSAALPLEGELATLVEAARGSTDPRVAHAAAERTRELRTSPTISDPGDPSTTAP